MCAKAPISSLGVELRLLPLCVSITMAQSMYGLAFERYQLASFCQELQMTDNCANATVSQSAAQWSRWLALPGSFLALTMLPVMGMLSDWLKARGSRWPLLAFQTGIGLPTTAGILAQTALGLPRSWQVQC